MKYFKQSTFYFKDVAFKSVYNLYLVIQTNNEGKFSSWTSRPRYFAVDLEI